MASFFKKHKRTPAELAAKLSNALGVLAESGDDKVRACPFFHSFRLTRIRPPPSLERETSSEAQTIRFIRCVRTNRHARVT